MHPELLKLTVQACRDYIEAGDCHGEAPPTERLIDAVVQLAAGTQELPASVMPVSSAIRDAAYNQIDRFLRNNMDDMDYADYSQALDALY